MQIPSKIVDAKARHEARLKLYREQISMHADSPYNRALVEAGFLDPAEMQASIDRHGLTAYEGFLATLRGHLRRRQADLALSAELRTYAQGQVARLENERGRQRATPPMFRDSRSGQLKVANHTIAATDAALLKAAKMVKQADEIHRFNRDQVHNLAMLEERLAAAVTAYVLREDTPPEAAQAPVVNLTVAMPAELKITAMPSRVTETQINRDDAGNIVHSSQIERDAA